MTSTIESLVAAAYARQALDGCDPAADIALAMGIIGERLAFALDGSVASADASGCEVRIAVGKKTSHIRVDANGVVTYGPGASGKYSPLVEMGLVEVTDVGRLVPSALEAAAEEVAAVWA